MNEPRYAPPLSNLAFAAPCDRREFYVVSPKKLLILFVITSGWYGLYWFYQQWAFNKCYRGSKVYPLSRAVFSFIYAFPLFWKVDRSLRRQDRGRMRSWWLSAMGVSVMTLADSLVLIGSNSNHPIEQSTTWALWSYAVMFANLIICLVVQRQINVAALDPTGQTNSTLSAANWVWIALGSIMWVKDLALFIVFGVN